jgi:hypothetical protein
MFCQQSAERFIFARQAFDKTVEIQKTLVDFGKIAVAAFVDLRFFVFFKIDERPAFFPPEMFQQTFRPPRQYFSDEMIEISATLVKCSQA